MHVHTIPRLHIKGDAKRAAVQRDQWTFVTTFRSTKRSQQLVVDKSLCCWTSTAELCAALLLLRACATLLLFSVQCWINIFVLLQVKAPTFKKKVTKNPNLFGAGGKLLFGSTQQGNSNSDSDNDNDNNQAQTPATGNKTKVKPNPTLLLISVRCCFQCSTLQYAVVSSASPLEATKRVVVGLVLPRHEFPL